MHTARLSLLLALLSIGSAFGADPQGRLPDTGITAKTLAVIVNDADSQSREIARYYQARRQIPAANIIHVNFAPDKPVMSHATFQKIRTEVTARTPANVQAYALTWTAPYRVECMSITTAFATGFEKSSAHESAVPPDRAPISIPTAAHPIPTTESARPWPCPVSASMR